MDSGPDRLAERIRDAVVRAALAAYEDAGMQGLCHEGAWEAAVSAMRRLDVGELTGGLRKEPGPAPAADA
jgi:hypothetical protein